jgi:hypothetical protein
MEDRPMETPPYYLRRPPLPDDPAILAHYEDLWASIVADPGITDLTAALPSPRWPFLAYLAERQPVLFHGSGDPALAELVPRQSNDVQEFGNRCAVYAASDGIWPIFYAILDRGRMQISLLNACFRTVLPTGALNDPVYFFSISQEARQQAPWRTGTVYILPRAGFEPRPLVHKRGTPIQIMEWASLAAVTPLAKLSVGPADFPFLDQIRGHDLSTIVHRAAANPEGFPWLDDDAAGAQGPSRSDGADR